MNRSDYYCKDQVIQRRNAVFEKAKEVSKGLKEVITKDSAGTILKNGDDCLIKMKGLEGLG
jgi:uncharacterized Zn ribbon protein